MCRNLWSKIYLNKDFLHWFTFCVLLSLFFTLSVFASKKESAVIDEIAHIPAGANYVIYSNPDINSEHPPLIKYLSATGFLLFNKPDIPPHKTIENQWEYGKNLLYNPGASFNADALIFWARIPIVILSVLLGVVIYGWARELLGKNVALTVLGFYCLDPNLIGYSHLVTFDLPMAFFATTALYFFWKAMNKLKQSHFILSGVFFGFALSSKITSLALLLVIIGVLILELRHNSRPNIRNLVTGNLLLLFSAYLTIWLIYFLIFRFQVGIHVLPTQFVYNLLFSFWRFDYAQPSFILGELEVEGKWWFLPISLALKTALPMLILGASGTVLLLKNYYKTNNKLAFYFGGYLILYLLVVIQSSVAIGLRYTFIIYPLICILSGFGFNFLYKKAGYRRLLIVLLPIYYLLAIIIYFPNYLTFSNGLVGSPSNNYRFLADSNLDWGQGLIQLKDYANQNMIENLQIVYFGEADPAYYGFQTVIKGTLYEPSHLKILEDINGMLAVSTTAANYMGLAEADYKIKGVAPIDLVANHILIYDLPQ